MGFRSLVKVVAQIPRGRQHLHQEMLGFHSQYNKYVHWHLVAHAGLLSLAVVRGKPKEVLVQGWLFTAVVPVHMRNAAVDFIRGVVQSPS